MPKIIEVREIQDEERKYLESLSRSRTAEKRMVERTQIIVRRAAGERPGQIAADLSIKGDTVTRWVKRFNEAGVAGLRDREGRGRKAQYDEKARGQMIAVVRTKPQALGLPFASWSIRRLCRYLNEQEAIGVSRAQLARILVAEGLRWYQEQTYFTERPDPQFVEKRGLL